MPKKKKTINVRSTPSTSYLALKIAKDDLDLSIAEKFSSPNRIAETDFSYHHKTIQGALNDLTLVIFRTHKITKNLHWRALDEWLKDICEAIEICENVLYKQRISLVDLTIDDEGPSELDALFSRTPEVESSDWFFDIENSERWDEGISKSVRLSIQFWIDTVTCYLASAFHEMIGAGSGPERHEARESLTRTGKHLL